MSHPTGPLERNVAAFTADTDKHGGYVYTAVSRWSSEYATGRQTDGLIQMLSENFSKAVRIADIGCGDGFFTMEIAEKFGPAAIRGIEPAENAVEVAQKRIPAHLARSVSFETGNIYDLESNGVEVAVIRGVLHHLDRPQAAIAHLAQRFRAIIALEPNGFNPAMKIIEKTSTYHREHDEKSYWPPMLNGWFRQEGYSVAAQKYFCLVPYFCPTGVAKMLAMAEPVVESVPGVRQLLCGTNLVLYRK